MILAEESISCSVCVCVCVCVCMCECVRVSVCVCVPIVPLREGAGRGGYTSDLTRRSLVIFLPIRKLIIFQICAKLGLYHMHAPYYGR
jgi:hypothetical protein